MSRLLEPLPEQTYTPDTESSVSIKVVRGSRVIEVSEGLWGEDIASEKETEEAIARLAAAVNAVL